MNEKGRGVLDNKELRWMEEERERNLQAGDWVKKIRSLKLRRKHFWQQVQTKCCVCCAQSLSRVLSAVCAELSQSCPTLQPHRL